MKKLVRRYHVFELNWSLLFPMNYCDLFRFIAIISRPKNAKKNYIFVCFNNFREHDLNKTNHLALLYIIFIINI